MLLSNDDMQKLKNFLSQLTKKKIPEIIEISMRKIGVLENSGEETQFTEALKEIVRLLRMLHRPSIAKNEEIKKLLIEFLTLVEKHDPRAKHALKVLNTPTPDKSPNT